MELIFREQVQYHPSLERYMYEYKELDKSDPKRSYESMLAKCRKIFADKRQDAIRTEHGLGVIPSGGRSTGKANAATNENDGVCRLWKSTGFCQNQTDKNKPCPYSHPESKRGCDKGKGKGKGKKLKGNGKGKGGSKGGKKGSGKGKKGKNGSKGKGKGKSGKKGGKGGSRRGRANAAAEEKTFTKAEWKAWSLANTSEQAPKATTTIFSMAEGAWCKKHTKSGGCTGCHLIHNPTCAKFAKGVKCDFHDQGKCAFPHREGVKGKGPSKPSSASPVIPKVKAAAKKGTRKSTVAMAVGSEPEAGDDEE
jgi:hypothetical protein